MAGCVAGKVPNTRKRLSGAVECLHAVQVLYIIALIAAEELLW